MIILMMIHLSATEHTLSIQNDIKYESQWVFQAAVAHVYDVHFIKQ